MISLMGEAIEILFGNIYQNRTELLHHWKSLRRLVFLDQLLNRNLSGLNELVLVRLRGIKRDKKK